MSSSINPNNLDGTFPIAGQDNDSQGFRTNFTNTKNNFIFAKQEIEDLQAKAILKSALTGTTIDNDMDGAVLASAEVKDLRETRVDLGTTSGTLTLNHANGHNYTVVTSGSVSLAFSNFPASGRLGRIRLEITINNTAHTMTFPSSVTYGLGGLAGYDDVDTVTFTETGTYIFEFTSESGGTDIHVQDLSRNRTTFQDTEISVVQRTPVNTGQAGDVAGMIAVDANFVYVCTAAYDGSSVIWKRSTLSSY